MSPRKSRTRSQGRRPGRLRIVAGRWRGRLLELGDHPELRPTPDRVRETLFNWLAPVIEGARVLDLCAGSGVLGLEALSRGAASAVFVERDPALAAAIRRSLDTFGAAGGEVVAADARRFLRTAAAPFDVVFADPPYTAGLLGELCTLLAERGWLAPGALVYLEYAAAGPAPAVPGVLGVDKQKQAGGVSYALYRHSPDLPQRA